MEPLIVPGSTTLFYGPSQAGKTQFVLTLLKTMQENGVLLGKYKCRDVRTLLVEADMPNIGFQGRLQTAMKSYNFNGTARLVTTDGAQINLPTLPKHTDWIAASREFKPELVIMDSLRKVHEGDENDNAQPSKVYGAARKLFPEAALVFLHHTKKAPAKWLLKGEYEAIQEDESYRGAAAWINDADCAVLFHVEKRNQRMLRVVRARYTTDDILNEVVPFQFSESGLFVEPMQAPGQVALANYRSENPKVTLVEAVEWLEEHYPGKSSKTYYNWAHGVGL